MSMVLKVLHKCGHEYEHNFKGKKSNIPAWLYKASNEDCPTCMLVKLTKEAEEKKLPMLTGSVEQRVWALTIRNEILLQYNLLIKELKTKKTTLTKKRKETLLMMILKVKYLLMFEKESAFWITHKSVRGLMKYKKVVTIKKEKPKPIEETDYKMNFEDDTLFDIFEQGYESRVGLNLGYLC